MIMVEALLLSFSMSGATTRQQHCRRVPLDARLRPPRLPHRYFVDSWFASSLLRRLLILSFRCKLAPRSTIATGIQSP